MTIYTRMAVYTMTSITTLIVFLMGEKRRFFKKKQLFVIVILEIQFLKVS